LPGSFLLDTTYVGKEGFHIFANENVNQPLAGSLTTHPGVNIDALRPYVGLDVISVYDSRATQNYQAFQLTLDRRFSRSLAVGLAYTWSKSIDDTSMPYNTYCYTCMRALSSFNQPQRLMLDFIYELPFFRSGRGAGRVLGAWKLSGVEEFRSGDAQSVTSTIDTAGVGTGSGNQTWNLVGSTAYNGPTGVGDPWFNKAAFALPAAGKFGNAGLEILRGPRFINMDMALLKGFKVTERLNSEIRFEAFNFLNHPNLSDPSVSPTSGSFGIISSKSDNRTVQAGAKLMF
jgi:hypothetical protein